MSKKIRRHKTEDSLFKKVLKARKAQSVQALSLDECLLLSLRHLDKNQGQSFHDWQSSGMLADAVDVLAGVCCCRLGETFNDMRNNKYTIYGDFPPPDKTDFEHPPHVPEDAQWARIHVNGKHCLIGHIVKNKFYLVFLDSEHTFWKTSK